MSSHLESRRSLTQRLLLPLLSAGYLTLSAPIVTASDEFLQEFNDTYPTSSSGTNAECALCHDQSGPTGKDFAISNNGYGIDLKNEGILTDVAGAFDAVESFNSDNDSGGFSNFDEIDANAQPGWTTGDPVPASVIGDLDPGTTTDNPPVANAGGDVTGTVGETIEFDGSGSTDDGTITDYAWNFGDGSTGSGDIVSHTYTTSASYTVTLTVTDDAGQDDSDTATADIAAAAVAPTADAGGPYSGTAGESVAFDGSGSSDDGTIDSYAWNFGDGNTGTGISPTHTYATGDVYDVSLTVTDNDGLTDTATTSADINNPPVSDPNGPYSGTVGVRVDFSGTESSDDGTIMSYAWDFGDGGTGIGSNPSHIYSTAATFDVSLTVTDNDGATDTAATTAIIAAEDLVPPVADANGPYSGTVNENVQFDGSGSSDSDGNIVGYAWDFGDNETGTGVNPVHIYTTTGEFEISLTVTDNDGLQSTDTSAATIGIGPLPPIADVNGPYTGTVGVPVDFDGTGSSDPNNDIASYDWDFGDGTFVEDAGPTPSHTYSGDGIFTVTLTVIDATELSDSASTTATIELILLPPVADPNGPYNATAGESVTFDGTGSSDPDGTVEEWNWDFGDGDTGTGAEPSHTYATADSYTVTLTVLDNDGLSSDPASTTADIVDQPQDPVADPNGPYSGKEGREVLFDGTASVDPDGGDIVSYDWDFGDGNTGIGPSPANIYATEGTYTVTLEVTDDEGQTSDPAETSAEIVPDEAPTADPNGPYSGIINVSVAFDGSASFDPDGDLVSWEWDFGDNTTGSGETTSHTYNGTGDYTVTLTVTDDFGNTGSAGTTATITEPTLLPPVADAGGPYTGTEGEAVTFDGGRSTDSDGNIVRYDWDFGDGTMVQDAGPNPTHVYSTADLYNVSLTVIDNDGLTDSDGTTADIQPVSTGDADVFISKMRVPHLLRLREDGEVKKRILVFGNGDTIEQDATVTLSASHPALEVEIEPESITKTVTPDGLNTRFAFTAEVECEESGSFTLEWTATIDAAENADPSNDSLTLSSQVECKEERRGRDRDDD